METLKLQISNLRKEFTDKGKKLGAVNGVSFDVYDGEFLSILGPSGCGKTTILRMLIGLLEVTDGKIYKDGEDITNLPPSQRGIGIVFKTMRYLKI